MYTGYGPGLRVIDNHMSTQVFPKGGEERRGNVIQQTGGTG
jgi:hypothetical protein